MVKWTSLHARSLTCVTHKPQPDSPKRVRCKERLSKLLRSGAPSDCFQRPRRKSNADVNLIKTNESEWSEAQPPQDTPPRHHSLTSGIPIFIAESSTCKKEGDCREKPR